MGKKYIIELLDECKSKFKGIMLFGLTQEKQISVEMIPEESMTPYIEPEPHAEVTADAYQRGYETAKHECEDCPKQAYTDALRMEAYQKGLSDAWEAARKIALSRDDGGIEYEAKKEIFGHTNYNIFRKFTVSDVIEKIMQYEQEKEEELGIKGYFKNGEEVIDAEGTKAVILRVSEDNYCQVYTEKGCIENWHIHTYKFHKTGRHFSEIAAVLEKMREGQDGL